MKISEFKPELRYYEIEHFTDNRDLNGKEIANTPVYDSVRELTDLAFPTQEDEYDRRWNCFYLPLRRSGRFISLPVWIMEYKKEFFIGFHGRGRLHVKKGEAEVENEYKTIFKEAMRFVPLIKKTEGEILKRTIPYDIRTGKIKGKYIAEKLMPESVSKRILRSYEKHVGETLGTSQISLNDYLNATAVCYRAGFRKKAEKLSPIKMYKRWADGRDCGMLEIKDKDSKAEFMDWLKHKSHCGGHPFEIVFSWIDHGIHLYPPELNRAYYSIHVTNYAYADTFVEMVKSLVKSKIPFRSDDLGDVLSYLTGETYFTVNDYGKHRFCYEPSREYRKKYFKHIEWDKIEVPRWR